MAALLGDLIQVIDNQVYLAQQVLNVYYYRITATLGLGDGYLSDMNAWFGDVVLDAVTGIQLEGVQHVSREWKNLSNGVDLFVDGTVVDGQIAGAFSTYLPSYVSLGFILRRESLATRNGYKRLAGISDTLVNGNDYVGSAPALAAIESAFAADVTDGLATIAEPIIVRRPITPPVASYVYASIGSSSFRSVGTQNSRKQGIGI